MTALSTRPAIIAGKPVDTGRAIEVLDPSTGTVCATVARCGPAEIDLAVDAARSAYESTWRHTTAAMRGEACRALARLLRAARDELGALESLDTGKPISQGYEDVDVAARYFEFYASTVEALYGETVLAGDDVLAYTLAEPYGVCGHITPWNYPLQVAARTMAPALAAGNCCVLKPAEDAPLTSLRLGELAVEAGFPPGALNVVPGLGEETGAALTAHPGVDHLAFTGSREVGQLVMQSAARNVVPVTLELGGKSPHIVLPDADLELAIPYIVRSILEHAGQSCTAGSRLLVHSDVHETVVARICRAFRAARIGPGASDPDLGPLISEKQRSTVLAYIEEGRRTSRLVTGGGVPADPALAGGFFVEPTLFDEVDNGSRIAQEEIFGPVLVVSEFADVAQAAELANATPYGLSAGIWTRDIGVAHWLAREIKASQVFVNNYSAAGGVELPFGGFKSSGFGREKGFEALRQYTTSKVVAVKVGPS